MLINRSLSQLDKPCLSMTSLRSGNLLRLREHGYYGLRSSVISFVPGLIVSVGMVGIFCSDSLIKLVHFYFILNFVPIRIARTDPYQLVSIDIGLYRLVHEN